MTREQRWVAIVALGAAGLAVAATVNRWLDVRAIEGGWFNYAPANGVAFSPGPSPWRALAVWLVVIALWFGASHRLLRQPDGHS